MASHHHHSNHHRTTACCCSCSCCSGVPSCCCSSNPSPPTLPTTAAAATAADPLLQALAAHLLQSQTPTHHLYSQQYFKPQQQYHHHKQQQQQAQTLLHSLFRRVAALESSLHHVSPPPPHPPPPPPPPPLPKSSLRDLAARTIQGRFRLYLVRRSQTLRHLKHLASVRSHLANLKSSLPEEDHLNPKALSQKSMDLLLQLDSIQSGDPMIREGKRSISRELDRLLEFADRVSVRRQELRLNAMEIVENGCERRALAVKSQRGVGEARVFSRVCEEEEEDGEESLKRRVLSSKPVKRVSFAENREESRVSAGTQDHGFEDLVSGSGQAAFMEELLREAEGIEGFSRVSEDDLKAHWLSQGLLLHQMSDDNQNPRGSVNSMAEHRMGGYLNGKNSHLGLSAPMPVQMEARRSDSKKNKNVVIAP